jgi:hypothetical protein
VGGETYFFMIGAFNVGPGGPLVFSVENPIEVVALEKDEERREKGGRRTHKYVGNQQK